MVGQQSIGTTKKDSAAKDPAAKASSLMSEAPTVSKVSTEETGVDWIHRADLAVLIAHKLNHICRRK